MIGATSLAKVTVPDGRGTKAGETSRLADVERNAIPATTADATPARARPTRPRRRFFGGSGWAETLRGLVACFRLFRLFISVQGCSNRRPSPRNTGPASLAQSLSAPPPNHVG